MQKILVLVPICHCWQRSVVQKHPVSKKQLEFPLWATLTLTQALPRVLLLRARVRIKGLKGPQRAAYTEKDLHCVSRCRGGNPS